MGVFRQNIAVDLGSANVKIAVEKKGIAVSDSSVVALRKATGEVVAIGRKASNMDGKIDKEITVIRPVSGGVISEYTVTVNMIGYFLDDAIKNPIRRMVRPDIITPLHCNATNVSKRAVERALKDAGAGRVFFVEAPLAAAIGANLDVSAPSGKMIVSISVCSYGMFLGHYIILQCIEPLNIHSLKLLPVILVIVVFLSWIITYAFSKIPYLKRICGVN